MPSSVDAGTAALERGVTNPGTYTWFRDDVGLNGYGIISGTDRLECHVSKGQYNFFWGEKNYYNGTRYAKICSPLMVSRIRVLFQKVFQRPIGTKNELPYQFARGLLAERLGYAVNWAGYAHKMATRGHGKDAQEQVQEGRKRRARPRKTGRRVTELKRRSKEWVFEDMEQLRIRLAAEGKPWLANEAKEGSVGEEERQDDWMVNIIVDGNTGEDVTMATKPQGCLPVAPLYSFKPTMPRPTSGRKRKGAHREDKPLRRSKRLACAPTVGDLRNNDRAPLARAETSPQDLDDGGACADYSVGTQGRPTTNNVTPSKSTFSASSIQVLSNVQESDVKEDGVISDAETGGVSSISVDFCLRKTGAGACGARNFLPRGCTALWSAAEANMDAEMKLSERLGILGGRGADAEGFFGSLNENRQDVWILPEGSVTFEPVTLVPDEVLDARLAIRTQCAALVHDKLVRANRHVVEYGKQIMALNLGWEKDARELCNCERTKGFYSTQVEYQKRLTRRMRATEVRSDSLEEQQRREKRFELKMQAVIDRTYNVWHDKETKKREIDILLYRCHVLKKLIKAMELNKWKQMKLLEDTLVDTGDIGAALRTSGVTCKCEQEDCFISPLGV